MHFRVLRDLTLSFAGLLVFFGAAGQASAAPVTFTFTSTISDFTPLHSGGSNLIEGPGGLNAGDSVSGYFTFETNQSATPAGGVATYSLLEFGVDIGPFSWTANGGNVVVVDDFQFIPVQLYYDSFDALAIQPQGPSINGLVPLALRVDLITSDLAGPVDVTKTFDLPSTWPDPNAYDLAGFHMYFGSDPAAVSSVGPVLAFSNQSNLVSTGGDLTSVSTVTEVPEPPIATLFGFGVFALGGLTFFRNRKRSKTQI
jgi:hypothetical protein